MVEEGKGAMGKVGSSLSLLAGRPSDELGKRCTGSDVRTTRQITLTFRFELSMNSYNRNDCEAPLSTSQS